MSSSTPVASSSDHSFFSKPKYPSAAGSSTVVTTRVVAVPRAGTGAPAIKVTAQSAASSSKPSRGTEAAKRKSDDSLSRVVHKKRRVSPDISTSNADTKPSQLRTRSPRAATSTRSSASSRQASAAPSPLAHELRGSPSTQATSVASSTAPPIAARECWIDEDGNPGRDFVSSEAVVKDLMKTYKAYFTNPEDPEDRSFDPHPTEYPATWLEYPNTCASERFILLAPKDPDHYNPIMCLESSLYTIIQHYLTPAQRCLFGTLPAKGLVDADLLELDCPSPPSDAPSPPSSIPSPASDDSTSSCSSQSSFFSASSDSSATSISSLSSVSALSSYATCRTPTSPPSVNYLRLLQRAIHKRDGPLFLKVMDAINALLCILKYPPFPSDLFEPAPPNQLSANVKTWTRMPSPVVQRIIDETYQRAVGPHVHKLTRYEAFSSEVYGELMPMFVTDIIKATGLREGMLFVDLGAGVGNVVLQAALETGCRAYGIEIMPEPAKIGRSQLEQFQTRCRMWGVRMGEVELEQGDMLKSEKVDKLVKEADVVLVNNKVFLEPLNEALRQKFLDLKEGAVVVSLKCLMGSARSTARHGFSRERSASPALKERNLDDIGEIFTVTSRPYYPGSVSWGGSGGEYFLQRMNREDYARRLKQFESSRGGLTRSTRSRR
ncbi:DOT1-domain-containing protein [Trametes coccinea BRFM310]|uniref:Histone-lysine N-methyltransferase, H3 lysine-79 specific n=1 Tax=Trametes coccinea (strain BRFM310) TaxID=1353009 RepID=A0A1Y2IY84_TRAC3|nr:DOT1-domain-containing protein [Trametes coccinea BRFM310]